MLKRIVFGAHHYFARTLKKPPMAPPTPIQQSHNTTTPNSNKNTRKKGHEPVKTIGSQHPQEGINTVAQAREATLKTQIKHMMQRGLTDQEIYSRFHNVGEVNLAQRAESEEDIELIKQDMLFNEIMQNHNKKELPIGPKYEDRLLTPQEQEEKEARIFGNLRGQDKFEVLTQDDYFRTSLESRYSLAAIAEAERRKIQQMKKFKEIFKDDVIKEHLSKRSLPVEDRRLKKGETYADLKSRDIVEAKSEKQQRKQKHLMVQNEKQLRKRALQQIEAKKRSKAAEGLVQFEGEQFYREKALKQFERRNRGQSEDDKLIKLAKDQNQQATDSAIMLQQKYQDILYDQDSKKKIYEQSTFGMLDSKIKDLDLRLRKLGLNLDIEQLKDMKKQLLFSEKKQREEQLEHNKYLMKKKKKDQMKEYFEKIHKEKLRDNVQFEIDYKSRFKSTQYDPLNVEENIERIKQMDLERKAVIEEKDIESENHFKKTEANIRRYLNSYFYSGLQTANDQVVSRIVARDIKFNTKKTVVYVFWAFEDPEDEKNKDLKNKVSANLKNRSSYISGKLTQALGLRYGPDIRFFYDQILPQTREIRETLLQEQDEIIENELEMYKQKGIIKTAEQIEDMRSKLEEITTHNIMNYNNRNKILSKKYMKNLRKAEKTPQKKEKNPKPSAEEKIWKQLDRL